MTTTDTTAGRTIALGASGEAGDGKKACGCHVGFCRASILLDGFGDAVMDGNERMARDLKEAYDKLAPNCVGGWRAIPPRED